MTRIQPNMTVLDVVSRHRSTVDVFKRLDRRAGVCICCQALFDPLATVAERYHLDLDGMLADLEKAADRLVTEDEPPNTRPSPGR